MSLRRIFERFRWNIYKNKLGSCGQGTFMKEGFKLVSPRFVSFGSNTHFGRDCQVCAFDSYMGKKTGMNPCISIGNNVTVTEHSYISCINRIEIGDGCLFGINTFITDNYHGKNTYQELLIPPNERELYSKGPVIIGKNVWVGRNVCIMPGVTIGDGAVIGANAVVTHDIPSCSIAVGVPAIVIKTIE